MKHYIGIEGGGTKFVCAHGSGPHDLQDRIVIPTATPDVTVHALLEYIQAICAKTPIAAIGVGMFGPLNLDKDSTHYGRVGNTTKKAWVHFDFVGALQRELKLPIGFDTDVNATAISEYRWGAAQGLSDFIYLTIGTGIGAGIMANHQLIHGAMHPETGHILIPQDKSVDPFQCICRYHQHCFEGLASGPAIKERWQVASALDLPPDHPAWDLEASYIGLALANYTLCYSPKRIIVGGGVMRQQQLLPKIRQQLLKYLGNYIENPLLQAVENYVVKPGLAENAGVCGGIALAEIAR